MLAFGATASAAEGRRYFVDATSGNDSNSGLTSAVPWKTLAKVNGATFAAGNKVLFKRGETWREQLTVPSSGSAGNPITFGAYGTGNNPQIKGSLIATSGMWTSIGSNVWVIFGITTDVNFVRFNGTLGTKITSGLPSNPLEWIMDASGDALGVYSVGNPATTYTSPGVEVGQIFPLLIISSKNYVTVDGIDLNDGNLWATLLIQGTSDHITITRCVVSENYGTGIMLNENTGGDHRITENDVYHNYWGVHLYKSTATAGHENIISQNNLYSNGMDGVLCSSAYNIFEHNNIYDNGTLLDGTSGIRMIDDDWETAFSYQGTNNIIRYNKVYDNAGADFDGHGILLDHGADSCEVYYNVIYNNYGIGVGVYKSATANVYNNIAYGNAARPGGHSVPCEFGILDDELDRTIDVNLKNNIGFSTISGAYAIYLNGTVFNNSGISVTNNLWYRTSGDWWYESNTGYGSSLSTWNAKSFVGADLNADPLFTNPATVDFTLQSASPCINAGTDVGLTTDFAGNPIVGNPDIGAFEYQP
jgi:hypothetical protein